MQTKTLSKLINVSQVGKMLQHFENHKFIKTNNKDIQFGFLTESLQDLVRKEWLLSNVVASDWPAFLFSSLKTNENLKAALEDVKDLTNSFPFSLVEVHNCHNEKEEKQLPEPTNAMELVSNQFKKQLGTILRNQTFCMPNNAVEIFHKKQRDRKNWWRKFAAFPGRFVTSNVTKNENEKTVVSQIQAEFPWGLETVETIKYSSQSHNTEDNTSVEVKLSRRKKILPQVVSCEAVLENMSFTYLCDSYEKRNENSDRVVLKFARKLAPFKVAIAGTGSTTEIIKSLEEVSLLLAKQARKLGFSVLLLPDAYITSIEKQFLRNDALGVPYTLLLNDKTLQVGTIALRSRDTMLQEDSHVGIIMEYLGKILK